MASSYSTRLRLELMASGENDDTWGETNNRNLGTLLEQSVAGIASIVMGDADYTLTATNGASDEARNAMLVVTSSTSLTTARSIIVPSVQKTYIVRNLTTGGQNITVKPAGGTPSGGIVAGADALVYCDGSACYLASPGYNPATDAVHATNFIQGGLPIATVPAGAVMPFAGTSTPTGWLLCGGQAVSRTTYAALFAAIGTTFGAGDGSTTFNVPDARDRAVAGKGDMGGSAANRLTSGVSGITSTTLGAAGGDERLHAHNHGVGDPGHTHGYSDPGHSHSLDRQVLTGSGSGTGPGDFSSVWSPTSVNTNGAGIGITIAGSATNISIQTAGAGGSQNVQPTLILNYIIKT